MRIRIVKKTDATVVKTSNESGKMSIEESKKTFEVGEYIGGIFDAVEEDDLVDLHSVDGSVITDVPVNAIEIHGDKPAPLRFSRNCCQERRRT